MGSIRRQLTFRDIFLILKTRQYPKLGNGVSDFSDLNNLEIDGNKNIVFFLNLSKVEIAGNAKINAGKGSNMYYNK